ncbi:helix-turn-helix transcriptional regulator [Glaciibacter sp. 2TAF33]|uniref:helix-turn-helix transcriptional regulator n=1 Tax=Glaciibacter sp. 2TAF33 TaxID=3233015 RepID=UPI003F8DA495
MKSSASSAAMIGRESDLADLHAVLADSLLGIQRCVVIAGEAGIGKSRLLEEFQAETRDRVLALVGQCVDLGTVGAPYAPIMGVLRDLVSVMGAEAVNRAAGPGRAALWALLPELKEAALKEAALKEAALSEATGFPEPAAGTPVQETGLNHLHEVVAVLLENFSRQTPLLVVIEDLHWADGATLNLLRFLLKVVTRGRMMFVLSYRSDDVPRGHPLRGFLSELERSRRIVRSELGRLTRAQVLRQAQAILGSPPGAEAFESVFERSEGVPFFVEELLGIDDCDDGGVLPETLRELLLARYERLSPPTQHLLRLISAGGVRVRHDLLSVVFEGDADALDVGAREAVLANVLVADVDSYAFRHALVREAIQADLLPGERTRFHTRFAEALEALPQDRRVAVEIAYHWTAAHNVSRAFPASLTAMAEAKASYAYSTAAQMGERALELWDQVPHPDHVATRTKIDLMGQTASALRNAGKGERSLAMVNQALAECPPDDGFRYARLLRDKAYYLATSGSLGSIELLKEALALVPEGSPGDLRSTILTGLAARFMIEARPAEAIAFGEEGLAEAQRVGSARYSSVAANMIGIASINRGQVDHGMAQLERARQLAEGDGSALLRYRVNYSDMLHLLGRYREAVTVAERGLVRARELGLERSSGVILASNAVDPLFALGEWDRADTLIQRGLDLDPPLAFAVYMHRARLRSILWRGDSEAAAQQLRAVRSMMSNLSEVEMQTRLGTAQMAGEIALACGDLDRAWAEASVLLSPESRQLPGYDLPLAALAARVLAARRAAEAGDVGLAEPGTRADQGTRAEPGSGSSSASDFDLAERQLREVLAHDSFWPTFPLWNGLFEAELGGPRGTGTDPTAWQEAVDEIRRSASPVYLLPYAQLRLGIAQIEVGERQAALETLRAASVQATEIGAGLVTHALARVASRAGLVLEGGAAAHRRTAEAPDLTTRERQVLELIAQGLSNRQIGEQLFISAKTASVHVSAILRKLGASSRTEAVFLARSPANH